MHKKNSCDDSLEELYGFAEENFVYKLQSSYAKYFTKGPVLDIACGRGIFLEILKEHGLEAVGVDDSKLAYRYAKDKNLAVYLDDAFTFLKNAIKNGKKYEGIFCAHFIEHLPCERAQELLSLCFKILRPGGILIVITPNPRDLRVMTDIFWLDQTHVRPYPLDLLKRLFTKRGFKVRDMGIDQNTKLKHFKNLFFDKISKFIFSKTPLGIYLNTGHDNYIIGEKPV